MELVGPRVQLKLKRGGLWRGRDVQRGVVVLEQGGSEGLEEVQEGRQGLGALEEAQVLKTDEAKQGLQVVVVDQGRTQDVEAVQGEGQGLGLLEGQ